MALRDYQAATLNLLVEFDRVCSDVGAQYCIVDRLGWREKRGDKGFKGAEGNAVVAMLRADYDRAKPALEALENREIEETKIDGIPAARFVDSHSTFINMRSPLRFEKPGLAITIKILEPAGRKVIYAFEKKSRKLSTSLFFPARRAIFSDAKLCFPPDMFKVFGKLFAKPSMLFRRYPGAYNGKMFEIIYDLEVPYAKFMALKGAHELASEMKFVSRPEYDRVQAENDELEPERNRVMYARRLTAKRVQLWQQLYPIEDELVAASESGNEEFLREHLKDYVDQAADLRKFNHSLYIDPVLERVAKPLVIERLGQKGYAEYEASICPEYKVGMAQILRDAGVEHPLL